MYTATAFGFTDEGEARITVNYLAYDDITKATIDIKIEKQGLFFFRSAVVEDHILTQDKEYQNEFFYPISENGTY
jgi:hypothetical protein